MSKVEETKKVWEEHIKAWDARDLDAIMVHYTEESIMILNSTVKKGITEIRNVFDNLFKLFSNGENIIDPVITEGEVVYFTWNFKPEAEGGNAYFGTDSMVVQNGIVTYQTIASLLYEKYLVV